MTARMWSAAAPFSHLSQKKVFDPISNKKHPLFLFWKRGCFLGLVLIKIGDAGFKGFAHSDIIISVIIGRCTPKQSVIQRIPQPTAGIFISVFHGQCAIPLHHSANKTAGIDMSATGTGETAAAMEISG